MISNTWLCMYHDVIVISQYEYDILVITRVRQSLSLRQSRGQVLITNYIQTCGKHLAQMLEALLQALKKCLSTSTSTNTSIK